MTASKPALVPGTRISFLKILSCSSERDSLGKSRKSYKCECDCGNIVYRKKSYLEKFMNTNMIMSCGCHHPIKTNVGCHSHGWDGYEEISGFYFAQVRHGAKIRNIPFLITKEDIWNLYIKQDRKCALTKLPIFFTDSQKRGTIEQTVSIDRINCDKDYTLDNIQLVHKTVNRMKWILTNEEFIEICRLVALNN